MALQQNMQHARRRRKMHIRKSVVGSPEKPRLSVYRSAKYIYAQLIDDETGITLASASSLAMRADGCSGNRDEATAVGKMIAEAAKAKNVSRVVFDRNGYLYHGRVAALADAAREAGLIF
ncbi:MAG: 50S ribosomal protein L18 [Deltaproteobacteria bacterium]|nr:50S ribosomal protein L18 [Deltaproteobacteria bacterium]